jgi:AcrR family transcriptional regulator
LGKIVQIPVGRPKDLEKRQRILSVAKALFLAHGYHASSMNQIAREAGVTKLTVYNHFQDKATLFSCAIEVPVKPFCMNILNSCSRAVTLRRSFIRPVSAL